jgi:hypothetical protein
MLAGIAAGGIVSLALVLFESWQAWRGQTINQHNSSRLFGIFTAPVGFFLAGFGALFAAIAFPLDDYWHVLYGIDVTLWAPFHVMIVASLVMVGLGTTYALASELRRVPAGVLRHAIEVTFAVMLSLTLATLLILISQANVTEGLIQLGNYQFVLYPILLAISLPLVLVPAVSITRITGAATIMALSFILLRQSLFWFVPWAVEITVISEGLSYRSTAFPLVICPPTG